MVIMEETGRVSNKRAYSAIFISSTIRETVKAHEFLNSPESDISSEMSKAGKAVWSKLEEEEDYAIVSLFDRTICWNKIYDGLEDELEFYSVEERDCAKRLLSALQSAMQKFPHVTDRSSKYLFPERSLLENYLICYYSLTKFLFAHSNLLQHELILSNLIENDDSNSKCTIDNETGKVETLGELLTHAPAQNNCSIYSPYCAEALLMLYESLPKLYDDKLVKESLDDFVQEMVNGAFAVKANRSFRHYVVRDNMQALLSCENTHNFLEKKSTNLSSFELIRPVRLFGKIRRHADYIDKDNLGSIPITIVGGIYIDDISCLKQNFCNRVFDDKNDLRDFSIEMFDLYNWLSVDPATKDKKFDFDIHINYKSVSIGRNEINNGSSVAFRLGNINIIFKFDDYYEICRKDRLDSLILDNQLLLILDCPFIYENTKAILGPYPLSDVFSLFPKTYSSSVLSLSELRPIQTIQMQMNTLILNNSGRIGKLERKLREPLLEYISYAIKSKKQSEAFIFISSHKSVNASRYIRQYVVRTEKYNGKEIGLLHFGGKTKNNSLSVRQLDSSNNRHNYIIFSLWNLIVNTDVTLTDKIIWPSIYNCREYDASKILIKLEWKNTRSIFDQINISISEKSSKESELSETLLANEKFKEKIKSIVYSYFNLIFNNSGVLEPVVRCMQNSFYNVFFSKIDNIYEIIAFQRLREKLERNEAIEIGSINILESDRLHHNDIPALTSYKKMYVDIISNFSQNVPSESVRDILVAIMRDQGMDVYGIYDNIINACDKLDFIDTPLYKNIIAARGRL